MATHSTVLAEDDPMDRGAQRATVPEVKESWTQLHACTQRDQEIFSAKKFMANILGSVSSTVSAATTPIYYSSVRGATGNTQESAHGCAPVRERHRAGADHCRPATLDGNYIVRQSLISKMNHYDHKITICISSLLIT